MYNYDDICGECDGGGCPYCKGFRSPEMDDDPFYDDFADPGGNSALRAATPSNPRNLPCPTCGEPNRLTPRDVQLGYQCDSCADAVERGW